MTAEVAAAVPRKRRRVKPDFLLMIPPLSEAQDAPRVGPRQSLRADAFLDLVQHDVGEQHQDGDYPRPREEAESREHADRARAPDRRRGVDAAHRTALVPDEAGAHEAHADHDLPGDA